MKFLVQIYLKGLYYFIVDKNFRKFFYLTILYGLSLKRKSNSININGNKLKVLDFKSFVWQFYEIYFKGYYTFKTLNSEPVIIDCGSNIGLSLLNFKAQYKNSKIYAFEADKNVFDVLQGNIQNNKLENINLFNQAVWVKNEKISFLPDGVDGGRIEGGLDTNNQVDAIDFNEFLKGFNKVDFLKMDIEGAETSVIPHIKEGLSKVDNLFIEFHSFDGQNQAFDKIITTLTDCGFRIYIDNVVFKNHPFINKKAKSNIDLQLNIFAYKI